MGSIGQIAEVQLTGADRPRLGNVLFGAFGRDFATRDGKRVMVVAITPRQWTGLVGILGLDAPVAALEAELGVSFARDESLRFVHRAQLLPLFDAAFAQQDAAALTAAFEGVGVCWGPYQGLSEAVAGDPYFSAANPVLSAVAHPGGRYLTPGAPATLPGTARLPPQPSPVLGRDTEDVLAAVLRLPGHEIARLHDAGLAVTAGR